MPANSVDKLLDALPEPYSRDPPGVGSTGVNYKLAQSFQVYYDEWQDAIDAVGPARFDKTAVGAALDGKLVYVGFSAGGPVLTDGQKRLLLGQKKAKLWGAPTYDELLGLVVSLTGMSGTDVTVRENMAAFPATTYEPAVIEFLVTSAALIAAGVPPGNITSLLQGLASDLSSAAVAGVLVRITLLGGALYDTGLYGASTSGYAT